MLEIRIAYYLHTTPSQDCPSILIFFWNSKHTRYILPQSIPNPFTLFFRPTQSIRITISFHNPVQLIPEPFLTSLSPSVEPDTATTHTLTFATLNLIYIVLELRNYAAKLPPSLAFHSLILLHIYSLLHTTWYHVRVLLHLRLTQDTQLKLPLSENIYLFLSLQSNLSLLHST